MFTIFLYKNTVKYAKNVMNKHCVKNVRIRYYSGLHFSRIFPHSEWIRRDAESFYGFFLRSEIKINTYTGWKVSKYGVISGPYFPVFGVNTEICSVNLRIQSEYRKIWTRNNSVFGHFSRSVRFRFQVLFVFSSSILVDI